MIELEREHMAAMMEAGYIYIGMRRYKEARELFEGLCVLAPDSEVPMVALGNVEFCQGKVAKAIKHYNRALKVDPDSAFAKVYLGEALFFSGKKDEALELIETVAKDDKGGAGEFAQALLDAVEAGFDPNQKEQGQRKGST
jgi:predicted Zn-dependent protease